MLSVLLSNIFQLLQQTLLLPNKRFPEPGTGAVPHTPAGPVTTDTWSLDSSHLNSFCLVKNTSVILFSVIVLMSNDDLKQSGWPRGLGVGPAYRGLGFESQLLVSQLRFS